MSVNQSRAASSSPPASLGGNLPILYYKGPPQWVTGFLARKKKLVRKTFLLKVNKKRATNGVGGKWQVEVLFEINLDRKYEDLILKLQRFFGVGRIYYGGNKLTYRITNFSDLWNIVVPHFTKYPFQTRIRLYFLLWVKALELMSQGAHLLRNRAKFGEQACGFLTLLSIYARLGRGASKALMQDYPDLLPADLPVFDQDSSAPLDLWWLCGYLTIGSSFIARAQTAKIPSPFGLRKSAPLFVVWECALLISRRQRRGTTSKLGTRVEKP